MTADSNETGRPEGPTEKFSMEREFKTDLDHKYEFSREWFDEWLDMKWSEMENRKDKETVVPVKPSFNCSKCKSDIYSSIIWRIGSEPPSDRFATEDDVYNDHRSLSKRDECVGMHNVFKYFGYKNVDTNKIMENVQNCCDCGIKGWNECLDEAIRNELQSDHVENMTIRHIVDGLRTDTDNKCDLTDLELADNIISCLITYSDSQRSKDDRNRAYDRLYDKESGLMWQWKIIKDDMKLAINRPPQKFYHIEHEKICKTCGKSFNINTENDHTGYSFYYSLTRFYKTMEKPRKTAYRCGLSEMHPDSFCCSDCLLQYFTKLLGNMESGIRKYLSGDGNE
jgi:hypothetical protein